jgi:hypothetical protein
MLRERISKVSLIRLPDFVDQSSWVGGKRMNEHAESTPWIDVLAGTAPFCLWGFTLITSEIPHDWLVAGWIRSYAAVIAILLILLPAGVGIGWVLGFPRWSYSYLLSSILLGAYLTHASTPGLQFFGYPTFGRELWGWRAWIPLLLALLLALLISRSLRPAIALFTNIRSDPTLLAYSLFGLMPLLIFAFYDEMDRLFSLYFMVAFAAVSIAASILYLGSSHIRKSSFALLVGVILSIFLLLVGPNLYWQSHGGMNPLPSVIFGIVLAVIMIAPILFKLIGSSSHGMTA